MKSLKRLVVDCQDLVAIAGLTMEKLVALTVRKDGITIQLEALELVRVSRQFAIPRSKIRVQDGGEKCIHVFFRHRSAEWCTVILREKLTDFYSALGVDVMRIAAHAASKRLTGTSTQLLLESR